MQQQEHQSVMAATPQYASATTGAKVHNIGYNGARKQSVYSQVARGRRDAYPQSIQLFGSNNLAAQPRSA